MADRPHCVLLIPGFLAPDTSNLPLTAVVRAAGCRPAQSQLGSNSGPTTRVIEHLEHRVEQLSDQFGEITVVGVSLGGVFARRLARTFPDRVRQVISIGAPFRFDASAGRSFVVGRLWRSRLDRFDPDAVAELEYDEELKEPLSVPSTSVFSRMDGIVPFPRTLVSPGEQSENIEVKYATHIGLIVHPGVHLVLSDRIRQPLGEWTPFRIPVAARGLIKRADFFDAERARATG